jgi:hypothetical protein
MLQSRLSCGRSECRHAVLCYSRGGCCRAMLCRGHDGCVTPHVTVTVVVLHGGVVALHGAAFVVTIVMVGGWAMVGPGGRGQLHVCWQ